MLTLRSESPAIACLPMVVAAIFCSGCSDKKVPTWQTQGRVVYADDQSPVPGGVTLVLESTVPPHRRSSADLEKDGTFTMSSRRQGDGTMKGEHRVRFTAAITPNAPDAVATVSRVMHSRYTDFQTSGLTVDIKPEDGNDLTITVERPEGGVVETPPPAASTPASTSKDPALIRGPDIDD